jgi:hypothetical protein
VEEPVSVADYTVIEILNLNLFNFNIPVRVKEMRKIIENAKLL